MDNQGLREKTFEEPLCVECLDPLEIIGRLNTVVEPVQAEGAYVNSGGSRPQDDDEAKEVFDVPLLRYGQVFGVHTVPRNSDLGYVVQDVLDQDLEGSHRIEGEPTGSD